MTDQVHPLKPQWSQLVVRVLSMRSFRGGNSKTSYSIWALQWRVWYVSSHTKLSHTHGLIISYTLTHPLSILSYIRACNRMAAEQTMQARLAIHGERVVYPMLMHVEGTRHLYPFIGIQ